MHGQQNQKLGVYFIILARTREQILSPKVRCSSTADFYFYVFI